ncbi:MAG: hypothetical protein IT460_17995 [Planctomycetes bacterium]|nr:hypothetical protein [Planctomycetota bacterium]
MPSDPAAVAAALAAVAPAFSAWRSAVAATAEEVRGLLARQAAGDGAAAALGSFAAGRIDVGRFVGLAVRRAPADPAAAEAMRRAAAVLSALAGAPAGEQCVVRVAAGTSMRDAVHDAWRRLGRAFGAAHAVGLVQQGRAATEAEEGLVRGLAPGLWTRRERRVAPPLVVDVAGADLDVGALLAGLDGGAKVVLLVSGPCAPAPLVRLVTPGTFVLQTSDPAELAVLSKVAGPAVAALVPEDAAAFVHEPARGPTLSTRLVLRRVPKGAGRGPVGPWSAAQQAEELAQLVALGATDVPALASVPGVPAVDDPAGRVATWLLGAVDWKDLG